jgi:hypothetical protein
MAVLRSRKYSQLDDSEILKLYSHEPQGENLHFLRIEIEQRNLEQIFKFRALNPFRIDMEE